jgi:hypothetical protein
MSNRRYHHIFNLYRTQYLRSPVWFARRDRWFHTHAPHGEPLPCAGCGQPAGKAQLELHHAQYRDVHIAHGTLVAREKDEDLIPMHPYCHELLHRLIDRDPVLSRHRSRADATRTGLARLRQALTTPETS